MGNGTSRDSLCEEVTNIALPRTDDLMVSVRNTKIQTCIFWNIDLEMYGLCTYRLVFPQNHRTSWTEWISPQLFFLLVLSCKNLCFSCYYPSPCFLTLHLKCIKKLFKIWTDKCNRTITFKHFWSQMFNRPLQLHICIPDSPTREFFS